MPKSKKPPEKPKDQFKRFVETARSLKIDESGEPLEEVFKKTRPAARKDAPPSDASGRGSR